MAPPRLVVAGGTGLLGRALSDALASTGCDVVVLTRSAAIADPRTVASAHAGVRLARWTPDRTAGAWAAFLDGAAGLVNLAGESIGGGRWTARRKARLVDSRLDATRSLLAALAGCTTPPPVFVSASAVGYYGDRGDERLTEESPPGTDFLAQLCVEWEATARRAAGYVRRVATLRTGLVLDREGGALPRMVAPFRFFAGGPMGSGSQYISWIHIDDWVALVGWLLKDAPVNGAVNATAPNPVTNGTFARTVAAVLGRPALVRAPAFALRAVLGEMAEPLLLAGQRVVPERALSLGFRFRYPELGPALESLLRRR